MTGIASCISASRTLYGQLASHSHGIGPFIRFRVKLSPFLLLHCLRLLMQLALHFSLILIRELRLGCVHFQGPFGLHLILLHDHQVLLVEHLLLSLAYPVELLIRGQLLLLFLLGILICMLVALLLHLLPILIVFYKLALRLALLLHFPLQPDLSLPLLSYPVLALFLVLLYLLGLPFAQLILQP